MADNATMGGSSTIQVNAEGRERLVAVMARLRGEFHRAVSEVPIAERTVHGLANRWGIDRNLSQRLLAGLSPSRDELEAFAAWPGVRGLCSIADGIDRAQDRGAGRARRPLLSALEAFAEVVRELGGSQSAIVRALRSVPVGPGSDDRGSSSASGGVSCGADDPAVPDPRAGCALDAYYGVSGIRPSRRFPGHWQNITALALLGVRGFRDGVTLALQRTMTGDSSGQMLDEITVESLAEAIEGMPGTLRRYSAGPAPRFSIRVAGGEEVECIDLPAGRGPIDVVTGSIRDRVDTTPTPTGMCWAQGIRVKYPARRVVFDHYVHRSLDARWIASGNCFWWTPTMTSHPLADWHERLSVPVSVERDDSGVPVPALAEWDRAPELNRDALAAAGWEHADFVRYRVRVERPVWGSIVDLSFLPAAVV